MGYCTTGAARDRGGAMTLYVPIIEHFARLRSCYLLALKPRRSLWVATFVLWLYVTFIDQQAVGWIAFGTDAAEERLRLYRNWMGENRIGG